MKTFVAYYRVSTKEQFDSHLGLDAQKESVERHVKSIDGKIIESYSDAISGGFKEKVVGNVSIESLLKKRPKLIAAIEMCEKTGATLICKESGRISRHPLLIELLINRKVDFICSDSPHDTTFIIRLKTSLNAEELVKVSERTKAALAQRKKQLAEKGSFISKAGKKCVSLGTKVQKFTDGTVAKMGREIWMEMARNNKNNIRAAAVIKLKTKEGFTLHKIADYLNEYQFKSPKGGKFYPQTVSRLMAI